MLLIWWFSNCGKLRKFGWEWNIDVHDNEIKDEASPIAVNQQSQFESLSSSKSKQIKKSDCRDDINNLSIVVKVVANAIINQSTKAMI